MTKDSGKDKKITPSTGADSKTVKKDPPGAITKTAVTGDKNLPKKTGTTTTTTTATSKEDPSKKAASSVADKKGLNKII